MLIDGEALAALRVAAAAPEASRSGYWDYEVAHFKVGDDGGIEGSTVLANVSRKTGPLHTFAHWVLQRPYRLMAWRYASYRECERLGRLVARRQGRQFTDDMLRQVLALALIRHHVGLDDAAACNLVIGDGYGVMTALLLLAAPARRTIVVNLTKPLLLDLINLRKAVPEAHVALVSEPAAIAAALARPEVRVIAVRADDAAAVAAAPIGLAVNNVSMQEMEMPVIAEYFRILRGNPAPQTVFYCCNSLRKHRFGADGEWLADGSEIRFDDYPWDPDDRILVDGVCPWYQLNYNRTPPFWHYRFGRHRVVWHRLAVLEKA